MWLGLGIMMQFGVLYVLRVSSLFSLAINLTINPTGPALASKDCHPCPSAPAGIYWRICGTGGFGSWVVEHYLIPGSPEWLSSCAPTFLHQFVGEGRSNIPLPYWQPWPQRKKSQLSQSWHAQIRQVDRMVCVCVSNVFFFEARNWGSIGWFIHFLHHLLLHFWWHLSHLGGTASRFVHWFFTWQDEHRAKHAKWPRQHPHQSTFVEASAPQDSHPIELHTAESGIGSYTMWWCNPPRNFKHPPLENTEK